MKSITQAEYDKKRAVWRQELKLHERKLARLSQVDEQYYVTVAYLLEIASRGKELFLAAEPNEKRELIGLLGQNLLLDGKKVQITLYKPFDTLASCVDGSVWLPIPVSNLYLHWCSKKAMLFKGKAVIHGIKSQLTSV